MPAASEVRCKSSEARALLLQKVLLRSSSKDCVLFGLDMLMNITILAQIESQEKIERIKELRVLTSFAGIGLKPLQIVVTCAAF